MRVLDLCNPLNTKLKREGTITKIDLEKEDVYIKYSSYDLVTKLQFYGNSWGLL